MILQISDTTKTMYLSLDSVDDTKAGLINFGSSLINNKRKITLVIPTNNIIYNNGRDDKSIVFQTYYKNYKIYILNTKTKILHTGQITYVTSPVLQFEITSSNELNEKYIFYIIDQPTWNPYLQSVVALMTP